MRSQHLSCRARQAYRLLATCLLAGGGVMAQASTTELAVTAQEFRRLQEAPIQAKWLCGTITASFERVPDTAIQYVAENETRTVRAQGAPLLSIEVSMDMDWLTAHYKNDEAYFKAFAEMADLAWEALWAATENRKKVWDRALGKCIEENARVDQDIANLIAEYTPGGNSVLGLAHDLDIGDLWDEETLFRRDRPEVFITGKYIREFVLARLMQKKYFSRKPIQDLQKKVTKHPFFRRDWVEYQVQKIMAAPATFARRRMIRRMVTFMTNHQAPSEEAAEEEREKALAPLFDGLLPMTVYAPVIFNFADISEPRGRKTFLTPCWNHWRDMDWPNACLILSAKAIGGGRLLLISAFKDFVVLAGWYKVKFLPFATMLSCMLGYLNNCRRGQDPTHGIAFDIGVVGLVAGLLSTSLRIFEQIDYFLLARLERLGWCIGGLAVTFGVARVVWEGISSEGKPARKSKPYSYRHRLFVNPLRKLIAGVAIVCIAFVPLCYLNLMLTPYLWPYTIFSARQVWLCQQVPDYCMCGPDWKEDLAVSLGHYLGVGLWLLLGVVYARVGYMVMTMLDRKSRPGKPRLPQKAATYLGPHHKGTHASAYPSPKASPLPGALS